MPTAQLVWLRGRPWLGCAYVTTLIVAAVEGVLIRSLVHSLMVGVVGHWCEVALCRGAYRLTEIVGDHQVSGPPASRTRLRTKPTGAPFHSRAHASLDLTTLQPTGQGATCGCASSRARRERVCP